MIKFFRHIRRSLINQNQKFCHSREGGNPQRSANLKMDSCLHMNDRL